jgi:hypothetical protein
LHRTAGLERHTETFPLREGSGNHSLNTYFKRVFRLFETV